MEKEIQKTLTEIIESKDSIDLENNETEFELDETELRRYIDIVIREVKKDDKPSIP